MSVPVKPLPADDLDHVLAHTRELWLEARGQSFFITGGTGFFGMWLLESFAHANDALALGMRAVVLTRDPAAFAQKAPHLTGRTDLEFLSGDLCTFPFPAGRFDHLIHAAADTHVWTQGKISPKVIDSVVAGTRRVLDCAVQIDVRNLLLVSSGAVYGPPPDAQSHVSEEYLGGPDPLVIESAWGEAKRVTEYLCAVHAAQYGYALKVARCFSFVGPHLPLEVRYAIGNFLRDALAGDPITVRGDGTPVRSYLYAADLAIWLWKILFRGRPTRAYNVGSDRAFTIGEIALVVCQEMKQNAAVKIEHVAVPGRPGSRYVPAITRAKDELGLQVWTPLDEAIRKTADWHRLTRRVS